MALLKRSPLAPAGGFPALAKIDGVRYCALEAGLRYVGRKDLMMVSLAPGSCVAGVLTTSATRSAAVEDCAAKLGPLAQPEQGSAFLVNAGNANAFTGVRGDEAVQKITAAVASSLGIPAAHVYTSSTGVIGEPLAHERITALVDRLRDGLDGAAISDAAQAIMTTDTFPKGSGARCLIDGAEVRISGIAKGSGMIAPDMATMLAYIFTDVRISQPVLQRLVSQCNGRTFNCITVDSDTSTSDTVLVAATGRADMAEITEVSSQAGQAFARALEGVMRDLAHQIVRDGEGATKFVEIALRGARTDQDAHKIAMAIANSPLVKTAIAGGDPNWGRIVMAIGKSGAQAERDRLRIWFGDHLVAENGWVARDYCEQDVADYMKAQELRISVDMRLGEGQATTWTCDFTHGYIDINSDYRS